MGRKQYGMPAAAKIATGVILVSLALLAVHNGLGVPWPPVGPASWWDDLYYAIEIAAVALCGARVIYSRRDRGAWLAVTVGMALFTAGDLYEAVAFGANANNIPTPSPADLIYLSFYPCVYIGIGLLLRSRIRGLPAALWMDGVIAALAVGAIGATFVFGPVLANTDGAPMAVATNLAYPLSDVMLMSILVALFALSGWQLRGEWLMLAIGFGVFAVADSIYLVQAAKGTYVANGLLDVGWPGGLTLVAIAAWRPPLQRAGRRGTSWAVFLVPAIAGLVSLGLEFADHYVRLTFLAHLLASLCLLAVIIRLAMTFTENLKMLAVSRHDAITDALTGLGNRRALKLALEDRLAATPVEPCVVALYDLDGFKDYNDTFGHGAGDALLSRMGERVSQAVPQSSVFRMGGDEFCVVVSESEGGAEVASLAAECLQEHGSGFSVGCSYGVVHVPREADDAEKVMMLADARMYEHKDGGRPRAADESQNVLLRAIAERDNELGQHNDDVADLVELVAREVGLERADVIRVRRAAELHDVGKLAVPDTILNKPGPLDESEWEFMRRHTLVGERILASAASLRDVAPVVRSSHERWDGGGYPDRLAGDAIPLGARIIAVCDAFDAMVTARPYRAAMTSSDALVELKRCSGTQFDPEIVVAFERALNRRAASDTDDAIAA